MWLARSCEVQIFEQCLTMQIKPLQHRGLRPAGKSPLHHAIAKSHADPLATTRRTKVRRIVVVVKNRDRDAEKATDDRHQDNIARTSADFPTCRDPRSSTFLRDTSRTVSWCPGYKW